MTRRLHNLAFLLLWLLALVCWDLYQLAVHGSDATISATLLHWHRHWPFLAVLVAFALGLLAGHLFFPQEK